MLTSNDEAVHHWLAVISPILIPLSGISPSSVKIQEGFLIVECESQVLAHKIRQIHEKHGDLLKESSYGLQILVKGEKYSFIPPARNMNNNTTNKSTLLLSSSQWGRQNPLVLDLMTDDGSVSIHSVDSDRGYQLLDIAPYQWIEDTLCLPRQDLVGRPVMDAWDKSRAETEIIAVTKHRVIEEAIASGQKTTHTYQMKWSGLLWEKSVTGVIVNDEVLLITRDTREYQREFWRNYAR